MTMKGESKVTVDFIDAYLFLLQCIQNNSDIRSRHCSAFPPYIVEDREQRLKESSMWKGKRV